MANEITYSGSLSFTNGSETASMSGSGRADMAGLHYIKNVQDVGTSEEAIVKGDVGTIGMAAFRNLDDTNFVEVGGTTAVYCLKLKPGEFSGPIRWDGTTAFAKANTAGVKLEVFLIEA